MLLGTHCLNPHHDETLCRTVFRRYYSVACFHFFVDSAILNRIAKRKKMDGRSRHFGQTGRK